MSERVYLSFNRYEDSEALINALNGSEYKSFIQDFDQEVFRRIIKYGDYSLFSEIKISELADNEIIPTMVEKLREKYWEMYSEMKDRE